MPLISRLFFQVFQPNFIGWNINPKFIGCGDPKSVHKLRTPKISFLQMCCDSRFRHSWRQEARFWLAAFENVFSSKLHTSAIVGCDTFQLMPISFVRLPSSFSLSKAITDIDSGSWASITLWHS